MSSISQSGNVPLSDAYLVSLGVGGISVQDLNALYPGYSTLSPAEQKDIIDQLAASNPTLYQTGLIVLTSSELSDFIKLDFNEQKAKIIDNMLDSWIANLQAVEEQRRAEENSPSYLAKQDEKSASHQAVEDQKKLDAIGSQSNTEYHQALTGMTEERRQVEAATHRADPNANQEINPLVIGTAVGTAGVINIAMIDFTSTPIVGQNPIQDAWNSVAQPLLPDNLNAVLSQIGALMAAKLMDFSNIGEITTAIKDQRPVDQAETAKQYASALITAMDNPKFTTYLQNLVISKSEPGQPINPKEVDRLVALIKTVLLTSALAALNFIATKHMSGEAIGSLINPNSNIPLPDGDMGKLILQIRQQLSVLSPSDRMFVMNGMLAYLDKNPSIKNLTTPTAVFSDAFPSNSVENSHLDDQQV